MSGSIQTMMDDDVMQIVVDAPSSANALTLAMAEELHEALQRAAGSARAVLLSGANGAFCAGANVLAGAGFDHAGPDPVAPLITHFNPLISQIRQLPVPIVASVRGAAAGFGAALALACDIILVSDRGFFQQSFVRLGLVPDGASAFILVQAIGRVRATQMMMLGQRVTAGQALDWGLATEVVQDDLLDRKALETAQALASGPTLALAGIRQMAWAACSGDMDDALALETSLQRRMLGTADHRAARTAFLDKQPAAFSGR